MSEANSVFRCRTCNDLIRNRKAAYFHILTSYGLFLTPNDENLERKFLSEERVF